MIEYKKAGPKFLCSVTELVIDIRLHVFQPPPLIVRINLGSGVGISIMNILEFHLRNVPLSQTDLFLHPRMEGKQYTTKINASDVCLSTLD